MSCKVYQNTIFGQIISRTRVQPGPQELHALTEMQVTNNEKELQSL